MARYSFTINHMRTTKEFDSYKLLLDNDLFQGLEIFYPYQYIESNEIDKFNLYTENVYKLIDGRDLDMVLHMPFGGNNNDLMREDNLEVLERMYNACDYAYKFNVRKLTLHLGSTLNYTQKEYLDKSIENVCLICEYAKKYNQYVMIENMPSNSEVGSTMEEIKYIIEGVINKGYDNVKFIYDTGHSHVVYKNSALENKFLKELKPYLYHYHVHDNDSTRDQHARIGLGNINFEKVFDGIKEDYNELYTLEIIFKNSDDLIIYQNDLSNILEK